MLFSVPSPIEVFRGYKAAISDSLLIRIRTVPLASIVPDPYEDSIAGRLHDLLQVAAGVYCMESPGREGAILILPCEIMLPIFSDTIVEYIAIVQPDLKIVTCMGTGSDAAQPVVPFPIDELDWSDKTLVPFSAEEEQRLHARTAAHRHVSTRSTQVCDEPHNTPNGAHRRFKKRERRCR